MSEINLSRIMMPSTMDESFGVLKAKEGSAENLGGLNNALHRSRVLIMVVLGVLAVSILGCGKSDAEVKKAIERAFSEAKGSCESEKSQALERQLKAHRERCAELKEEALKKQEDDLRAEFKAKLEEKKNKDSEKPKESEFEKLIDEALNAVLGTEANAILLKEQLKSIIANLFKADIAGEKSGGNSYPLQYVFDDRAPEARNVLISWLSKNPKQITDMMQNTLDALKTDAEKAEFVRKIARIINIYEEALKIYPKFKGIMDDHPYNYPPLKISGIGEAVYDEKGEAVRVRFTDKRKDAIHTEYEELDGNTKFALRALQKLEKKGLLNTVKSLVAQIKKTLGLD